MSAGVQAIPPLKGDGKGIYRIHIVGNSGTGKFELWGDVKDLFGHCPTAWSSRHSGEELSKILDVPCIHLDALFFKPGWVQCDPEEFRQRVKDILEQNKKGWIVDGSYTRFLKDELDAETDIIWLDPPFLLYFPRIFIRTMKRLLGYAPPCAPGCEETVRSVFFDSESILWWATTRHRVAKRRYVTQMVTDGIDVEGKLRRIGGWGGELKRWTDDVRVMARTLED